MTPRRIQRRRTKGSKMQEGAVYVGRGSKFGNEHDWRDFVDKKFPDKYDNVLAKAWAVRCFSKKIQRMKETSKTELESWITTLRGHDLACWCSLCEKHKDGRPWNEPCSDCSPCHADILLEISNEETAP